MTTSSPIRPRAASPAKIEVAPISPRQVQADLSTDDQQRLFQALDVMQKEKADAEQRTNSVLDQSAREDQLVERLRQLRQAQGQAINEDELRAAVRATREPTNLAYEATPAGLGRSLANVYLARAKWLPTTMACLALAVVSISGLAGISHLRERALQHHIAAGQQMLQSNAAERAKLTALASRWPQGVGQEVFKGRFDRAAANADQALAQASALLASPTRDNIDLVDGLLGKSHASIAEASTIEQAAQEQVGRVRWANSPAAQVNDPVWPEITARAKMRRAALIAALETGNLAAAREETNAIQALSRASTMRSSLREAASLVPAVGQEEAQATRARGEAALLNADIAGASAAVASLRTLTDAIATSYTMKIVNEEGVKSGVWRYPNDNPGAKNYYVVVDALDASGNPIQVKVVNEETGKSELASRFAVRVSEAEYEKVKADKMDNGLIENALVGTKRPGTIKPEFNVDTAGGGIITEW